MTRRRLQVVAVLWRLLRYGTGRPFALAGLVAAMSVSVLLRFVPPEVLRVLTDGVVVAGGVAAEGRFRLLCAAVAVLAVSYLLGLLAGAVTGRLSVLVGTAMVSSLREKAFSRLLGGVSMQFLDAENTASLAARITHDSEMVYHFLHDAAGSLLLDAMVVLLVLVRIWLVSPLLAVSCVAGGALFAVAAVAFLSAFSGRLQRMLWHRGRLYAYVSDVVGGIAVVRSLGCAAFEEERGLRRIRDVRDQVRMAYGAMVLGSALLSAAAGAAFAVLVFAGGMFLLRGAISAGEFFMLLYLLGMLRGPAESLVRLPEWASTAAAGAGRIFEIIDAPSALPCGNVRLAPKAVKGELVFDDVWFGYDRDAPVLRGVSFRIAPGGFYCLAGPSGVGKSTLIKLLCRFYKPDRGRILLDGVDIFSIDEDDYARLLTVVLQEPFLFDETVYDNVRYARDAASPAEVIRASLLAGAHEFVSVLPFAYDTPVGEGGKRLSAGQRQRLALARAVLHGAPLLVMDEPVAAVDLSAEEKILGAMENLWQGRTVLVAAHRLSTLQRADCVIVLREGRVVEEGRHDELSRKGGFYSELLALQGRVVDSS